MDVLNYMCIERSITVNLDDLVLPDINIPLLKQSKGFRELLEAMDDHIEDTVFVLLKSSDGKYTIIDGVKRYLIFKDYIHNRGDVSCLVLKENVSMDDALLLRDCISHDENKKSLKDSIDKYRNCNYLVCKYSGDNNPEWVQIISEMTDMSAPSVYRLRKISDGILQDLLTLCEERNVSIRAAEAITTLTDDIQKELLGIMTDDPKLNPSEIMIKKIKEVGKIIDADTLKESAGKPSRSIGRARRDREIIEKAIRYDREIGVEIKNIPDLPAKVTVSNLISKQEDAVKALENRIYKKRYKPTKIDITRIDIVLQRLQDVKKFLEESMVENQSD